MSKKTIIILIIVIVLLAVSFAAWYFTRKQKPENNVQNAIDQNKAKTNGIIKNFNKAIFDRSSEGYAKAVDKNIAEAKAKGDMSSIKIEKVPSIKSSMILI